MITPQLLVAGIVVVVCLAGWVVSRQSGSWQRARQVIQDAERDVASWASAQPAERGWASAQPRELERSGQR